MKKHIIFLENPTSIYDLKSKCNLNIDNYELVDLLALFKLDFDFNEQDLKQVKKTVLQTHPDKSQLDKKYFLFLLWFEFSLFFKYVMT